MGAAMRRVNQSVRDVSAPPIADVQRWIEGRDFSALGGLLDVAQAVPVEPPHSSLLEHVSTCLTRDGLHRYTPIRGMPSLTQSLASHMNVHYGADIVERDVVITAGCNQAYCSALRALVGPGDEVLLPTPYYFNHQMWLDMLGATTVHIPFAADAGGVPSIEAFAAAVTPATKAIVVVTPNNPTGAIYSDELLDALYELAARSGIALIVDETYKDFHPRPERPHHLFEKPGWRDTLIQLFSFSKSYSLAGFRVGSLIGGDWIVDEVTKVQDCINICAAQVSQVAAAFALENLADDVRERARHMDARAERLQAVLNGSNSGFRVLSAGAWFAYVAHPFEGRDGYSVAQRMATEFGILSVPGSMFGPGQEPYLRFAFANLSDRQIEPLIERLAQVGSMRW
jgi:aspartate/methionine/tyrosine aminotransferase